MGWAMSNLLERFLQRKQRAALFRSWGAISSMLPKGGNAVWGGSDACGRLVPAHSLSSAFYHSLSHSLTPLAGNATWAPDMPSSTNTSGSVSGGGGAGTSFGQLLSFAVSSSSSSSASPVAATATATTAPPPISITPSTPTASTTASTTTTTTTAGSPPTQNVTSDTLLPFLFDATESLYRKRVEAEYSFEIDLLPGKSPPGQQQQQQQQSRAARESTATAASTVAAGSAGSAGTTATPQEDTRRWTNVLESALPRAPSLKFYCFYGYGKMTERSYFYTSVDKAGSGVNEDEDTGSGGGESGGGSGGGSSDGGNSAGGDGDENAWRPIRWRMDTSIHDPPRNLHSGVQDVLGDGTVPLLSLGYMCRNGWRHDGGGESASTPSSSSSPSPSPSSPSAKSPSVLSSSESPPPPPPLRGPQGPFYGEQLNPARIPIVTREYAHEPVPMVQDIRGGPRSADHVDILGNAAMTTDILLIVSGEADNEPLTDTIVSNIDEISARIILS